MLEPEKVEKKTPIQPVTTITQPKSPSKVEVKVSPRKPSFTEEVKIPEPAQETPDVDAKDELDEILNMSINTLVKKKEEREAAEALKKAEEPELSVSVS